MWDAEMLAMKQKYNLHRIYGEQLYAPHWHPSSSSIERPEWLSSHPSPAALSFNFAINQYTQPLTLYTQDFFNSEKRANSIQYSQIEELDRQIQG
ncbi:INVS [Bugula neritina]|uniref:INVS n=1 Tax=Bugula neritina TaxID=10212 RepID=A0A7J7IYZ1_BUGNE|nr:INVS [Bugula neritina]